MAHTVKKVQKLSHIIRARVSQDLRSSIMAPDCLSLRWLPRVFTNTIAIERELEKET